MTEVRYSVLPTGGDACRYYLCCEGHATGSQDVCAAVSAIAYTLAGYLANSDTWNVRDLDEGYTEIVFDAIDQKLVGAWEAAVFGLKQLANTFGDYVQVTCIQ